MYTKSEAIAKAKLNNKECKIALSKFNDWYYSSAKELYQVYGSYSQAKENAMNYCKEMMKKYEGYDLRIISHNSNVFSVGFIFKDDGKKIFAYITRDYDRFAYLN